MNKGMCLNPECKIEARVRGLCDSCYNAAGRLVREEKTSWEKLEKAGKVRPHKTKTKRTEWLLEKE